MLMWNGLRYLDVINSTPRHLDKRVRFRVHEHLGIVGPRNGGVDVIYMDKPYMRRRDLRKCDQLNADFPVNR